MSEKKKAENLYIVTGILSWIGLTVIDSPALYDAFFDASPVWAFITKSTFLTTLTLSILLFYKLIIGHSENESFTELFWKLSITGFIVVLLLTGHNFTASYLSGLWRAQAEFIDSMIEQGIIAVTLIFTVSCFYVFKKLILYQKTKEVYTLWRLFEYMIFLSPLLNYIDSRENEFLFQLALVPYVLLALMLSVNVKWIAYLNVKQKWNIIIYLVLILVLTALLCWNTFALHNEHSEIVTDLSQDVLVITLYVFISAYCLVSLLVSLFNLPTSSVFEKKFGEVLNFQKLSKSVTVGKTEDEVYQILLDSSATTLMASSAVIETLYESGNVKNTIFKNFDTERFTDIKAFILKNNIKVESENLQIDYLPSEKFYDDISYLGYVSLLIIPLVSYNEKYGYIYLFSEIKQGFEREMVEIVNTYASQACTSISNFRLINQAVSQAKYMREMEIAKKVQQGLLPSKLPDNKYLEMSAVSISADEVGGDYYDFAQLTDKKLAVVIGDVSGKGTSAAFHMAKVKGVFHSLATLNLPADEFMTHANHALSACLDKASFVTLTLLVFDFEEYTMHSCRAGHCPTLIYKKQSKTTEFIEQLGLGLGIIRQQETAIEFQNINTALEPGDIIFLYTDGISEAENPSGEQFGYERIATFLKANQQFSLEDIKANFLRSIQMFSESKVITDDYSLMLIRIK